MLSLIAKENPSRQKDGGQTVTMWNIATQRNVCDIIVIPLCGIAILRSFRLRGETWEALLHSGERYRGSKFKEQ
jgi:hypothetical protein